MSVACPVPSCGRQYHGDTTICTACAGDLARHLGDIPFLAAHLTITLIRMGRTEQGNTRGDPEPVERQTPGTLRPTPLPYDPRASDAAHDLYRAVVRWSNRYIPNGTTADYARWLLFNLNHIERSPGAEYIVTDIAEAVEAAERAIDRPPEQWYAGPCDTCRTDLYADPGATLVQCRNCRSAYGVDGRREHLLAAAEDALATATHAARALTSLGQPITPDRIWKWAERGRITAHGIDPMGRPQYRVGDLRALLDEAERKAAERRERTSA